MRPAVVVAFALAAAGCSLLVGEGLTGGEGPTPAGDIVDAGGDVADPNAGGEGGGSDVDAATDGDSGPPENLAPTPGFETTANTCGPGWAAGTRATIAPDEVARGGTRSCRVCSTASGVFFSIDATGNGLVDVAPGHVFRAEAWVRHPDGSPASDVRLVARIYDAANQEVESTPSAAVTTTTTWKSATAIHQATTAGSLDLYLEARPSSGTECFLVDDVTLVREE